MEMGNEQTDWNKENNEEKNQTLKNLSRTYPLNRQIV
jgi:hypothetical protein